MMKDKSAPSYSPHPCSLPGLPVEVSSLTEVASSTLLLLMQEGQMPWGWGREGKEQGRRGVQKRLKLATPCY